MPPSTRKKRTAVLSTLGNDWGSTAIRLFFYYIEEQRLEWVNNRAASNKCDETRYHNGSWSGYIDVSGNGPVYTGDDVPSAFQIPAKLIIGKGKGIDKTNPLLAVMKRNKGDAVFKRRCEEGPVAAVRTFAAQIEMHVQSKNKPLEIVDFGLTVPAHWTLDEMENYAKVLKRGLPRSLRQGDSRLRNLYFMTEVEAFAHFFFHDPDRVEEVLGNVVKHFVLFLDFGGHSMNGCNFFIRGADGKFAFIRAQEPFGVVGGSAQWEAAVGEFCAKNTVSSSGAMSEVSAEIYNRLLKKFREELRMLVRDVFSDIELRAKQPEGPNGGSGDVWTTISANQSAAFFREATSAPLHLAQSQIKELARLQRRCPGVGAKVIVSGGTAKNETVQGVLRDICIAAGLDEPVFVHDNMGSHESFNIARGAALATAANMTLLQFMENGAVFGIQMLQGDRANTEKYWDDKASIVLSGKGREWREGQPYVVTVSGADRFKIICEPLSDKASRRKYLDCTNTYDVLDLLVPDRGDWIFSLSMAPGDEGLLLKRTKVSGPDRETQKLHLEMEFRRSQLCFLVNADDSIESLHMGLGVTADGELVALTEELEQSLELKKEQARRGAETSAAVGLGDPYDDYHRPPAPAARLSLRRARSPDEAAEDERPKKRSGRWKPQGRLPELKPARSRYFEESQAGDLQDEGEDQDSFGSSDESYREADTSRDSSASLGALS
ncbi:hypothetical protein CH63R_10490 [Colletotrichum higginsianum IMI 349063]|uniref:Uncharacterized protein n=2 Tax=Colletotrichum higginsianum TaxID=80884 RepID=A0A1B7Y2X4_COLHI|nr:uncharacterized protein CH63R_10490 [Colletotrichum higginsianum IMI 349063]OBR06370.1 hypothetical protein CH63R_10490 [Colletotrichum higginsianum IMI 349063]TIC97480.1 hypothetical protein CH35J_007307 [Colletotrichum higginsianum]